MKDFQEHTPRNLPNLPHPPPSPFVEDRQVQPLSKKNLRQKLEKTFAALKYRNYRLWFMGQLVSVVGTWMQSTAQGFLVYELTHSPAYLGYVGFASGLPSWLFMLFGGVLADRLDRRKLLITTQSTMMILAFILGSLTFSGWVEPWHIVTLALCLGVANAFDAPARQAFVLELVDRKDLGNAIALNSSMFNSAAVVGPAVGGITYALFGPAWCFVINGTSFIAVIFALRLMKIGPVSLRPLKQSTWEDIVEGLKYTATHPLIRILIAIAGVTSVFGLAFVTLMPAWAVTILHGDARINGLLNTARALGALIAALMIASGPLFPKGKFLTLGTFVSPILLLLFSMGRNLTLSFVLLVGVGWGFMILFNLANTLVQTLVPDELRGRVMSIYTLTFFGFMPLGSLWAGALAALWGAPAAIAVSAFVSLLFALWLWRYFPKLRQLE